MSRPSNHREHLTEIEAELRLSLTANRRRDLRALRKLALIAITQEERK